MYARTIMDTRFHYLHPQDSIRRAVQTLKSASADEKKKIFGMMVMDDRDHLVGMLSMFDILLYLRPKHIRVLGEMADIRQDQVLDGMVRRIRDVRVLDLMTTDLVTVGPETHLLMVMEIMLQKHIRRMPVVDGGRVMGMIYRSDLFHHLMENLAVENPGTKHSAGEEKGHGRQI